MPESGFAGRIERTHYTGSSFGAAAGSDAVVNDSPVGCQSRGVTEPWVAGSAGSAAAGESCHRR